jgi:mitochondrial cardiolipin hydrolase
MNIIWLLAPFVLLASAVWACEVTPIFSPGENVEAVALAEIQHAGLSIHCSLFGITNEVLGHALAAQAKAGLDVGLALDLNQSHNKASQHPKIARAGAQVTIKKTGILEHSKYCLFDGRTVLMGSWNWSARAQAQDNSDVLLKHCPLVAESFERNYQMIVERDRVRR